jgi:hypothetical protein
MCRPLRYIAAWVGVGVIDSSTYQLGSVAATHPSRIRKSHVRSSVWYSFHFLRQAPVDKLSREATLNIIFIEIQGSRIDEIDGRLLIYRIGGHL